MLCILNDGLPSWAHTHLICTTDLLQSIILRASAGNHMRYSGLYDCSKTEACVSCTACCYILLYMPGQASHGWAWAYQRKTRKDCTFLHQFQWETRWDTAVPRGTYKTKGWPDCSPALPWYLRLSPKTLRIAWLQQDWDMRMQLSWCIMFCVWHFANMVKPSNTWKM